MNKKLHILHLEDSRNDAELVRETLAAGGMECEIELVNNRVDFIAALERERYDLILCDYDLPSFDGLSALALASAKGCTAPLLFVSGKMGEEIAIDSLKRGATDYIVKSNLSRLVPAIKRAIHEKEECIARESAEESMRMQKAELEIQNNLLRDAQIEIEESRNKYADLYNFAPSTFLTLDESGSITEINAQGMEMFGDELPHLIGRSLLDLVDALSRDTVRNHLTAVFSTPAKNVCVIKLVRPGGADAYAMIESLALRKRAGVRICHSALTDITERILSEERSVKAVREWQTTFDSLSDQICLLDAEGVIKQCNRAFLAYLKQSAGQVVGRQCWSVVHGTNSPLENCPMVQARETLQRETRDLELNGRWFTITVDPIIDSSGTAAGFVHVMSDITDRKQAEQTIAESERQFRETLENAAVLAVQLDREGGVLFVNNYLCELTGWKRAEILGRNWVHVFIPDDRRKEIAEIHRKNITSWELIKDYENEIVLKNGQRRHIVWSNSKMLDAQGALAGITSLGVDITERKNLENALRDSLDKFRSVAEQSLVGIYIIQNGRFKYANKTFAAMFGYTVGEVIDAQTPRDLTVPEDWSIVEDYRRRRMAGISLSSSYDIRGLKKDGGIVSIEIYESQALYEGRTANIGAVLDISERKQAEAAVRDSEEKLKSITRTAPDAIILLNAAGKISYWNPAAEKMFGYSADEVIGKNLSFIMPERFQMTHAAAFKVFSESGNGQKLGQTVEMAGLRRDGTEFPLELSISGFLLNDERHASGIIRDITDRKKLEGQLLHAQKMEAIGTLAGGIAHDFNNILNVIIGYGSLVLDGMETDHPSRERMREVLAAADRAANLTKRLLMFSRKSAVDVKPVKVNGIVITMEKFLSRVLGEDIELNFQLAAEDATVIADAGQIEQVLMNLVTNARDAMKKGGRLTISTGTMEIDNDYIFVHGYGIPGEYASIHVADTGTGMDAETEKKIFEPFYTTKGVGEGTGLGLSIAYGIVKQHKGFIQVYSEVGKGTLFKILLPLSNRTVSELSVADASGPRGGDETILIAEDKASLRSLMRIILESFGYTVLSAADGEEVVRMFKEHRDRVRLVILDLVMPKKNGIDAADDIKKLQPGVRTLFMSGYSEDMIKKQGALVQGLVFIQKPISPKLLLSRVRELLDG